MSLNSRTARGVLGILAMSSCLAQACVSSEDGALGLDLPIECSPRELAEPLPEPCTDDISCLRSGAEGDARENFASEPWVAVSFPRDPRCRSTSEAWELRVEAGACLISFATAVEAGRDLRLCQPMLIHENAATFDVIAFDLLQFKIDGVWQETPQAPLRWRGPNWQSTPVPQDRLCQDVVTSARERVSVDVELSVPLAQWMSLQGPTQPVLIVPQVDDSGDRPFEP